MVPPDILVDHILKELSFDGAEGTKLEKFWNFAIDKIGPLDLVYKSMIWHWVFFESEKVELFVDSEKVADFIEFGELSTKFDQDTIVIRPSENVQWKFLTTFEKQGNPIGQSAFSLLCVIAKSKGSGITTPELSKITGQDPRSSTSRIKTLLDFNLIKRKQVLYSSHNTHLLFHIDFWDDSMASSNHNEGIDDRFKKRLDIVKILKESPQMRKEFSELRDEVSLHENGEKKKIFRRVIGSLLESGYIERDSENQRILKFVKDIATDTSEDIEFMTIYEEAYDKDDSLEQGFNDDLSADKIEESNTPSLNNIYPPQNQVFQLVKQGSKAGVTTMSLVKNLVGFGFQRTFSKMFDPFFTENKAKLSPINQYSIVRGYDFEGKSKFFRYFTYDNFMTVTNQNHSTLNDFTEFNSSIQLLKSLNNSNYKPVVNAVEILTDCSNNDIIYWHGDSSLLTSDQVKELRGKRSEKEKLRMSDQTNTSKKKRGRPRKDTLKEPSESSVEPSNDSSRQLSTESRVDSSIEPMLKKQRLREDTLVEPTVKQDDKRNNPNNNSLEESKNDHSDNHRNSTVVIGSFKAAKRQEILLEMIKENGGAIFLRSALKSELDSRMGSSHSTDNKTISRDIASLIRDKKISTEDYRVSDLMIRKILYLYGFEDKSMIEKTKVEAQKDYDITKSKVTRFPCQKKQETNNSKRTLENKKKKPSKVDKIKKLKKQQKMTGDSLMDTENDDTNSRKTIVGTVEATKMKSSKLSKRKPKALKVDPVTGKVMRTRMPFDFDRNDATVLYRAVIISRSFSNNGLIEWDKVCALYDNMDEESLRRKWPKIRQLLGGASGVENRMSSWEKILFSAISDGLVTHTDLIKVDYEFFLHLWEDRDTSVIESDTTPLFSKAKDNDDEYRFSEDKLVSHDLEEMFSEMSNVQKGYSLAKNPSTYSNSEIVPQKRYNQIKTTLKAIFATSSADFRGASVKTLLKEYDESESKGALSELLEEKDITFVTSSETETRFSLSEKFYSTFDSKFSKEFFKDASNFHHYLGNLFSARKGLILSPTIENGSMSVLIDLISQGKVDVTRVDRINHSSFEGYESRLFAKEKLDCDIIVTGDMNDDNTAVIKKIPVPTGKACSHIWVDLNGKINNRIWTGIIFTIISTILLRPCTTTSRIFNQLSTILSLEDLKSVLSWLNDGGFIIYDENLGYRVTNHWNLILGGFNNAT